MRDSALFGSRAIAGSGCSLHIRAEMHHIEAACHYQSSRLEEAEQAIRSAISIDPSALPI